MSRHRGDSSFISCVSTTAGARQAAAYVTISAAPRRGYAGTVHASLIPVENIDTTHVLMPKPVRKTTPGPESMSLWVVLVARRSRLPGWFSNIVSWWDLCAYIEGNGECPHGSSLGLQSLGSNSRPGNLQREAIGHIEQTARSEGTVLPYARLGRGSDFVLHFRDVADVGDVWLKGISDFIRPPGWRTARWET